MKITSSLLLLITVVAVARCSFAEGIPQTEAGAIEFLRAKGIDIKQDDAGHAVRLMSSGKPPMSADEYQLIGRLTHLEQMGLNAAPLAEDEWDFLKSLPKLKRLAIWHGKGFATLKPFSGLPVESLTIGGCMGLRDLNRDAPDMLRNAVTTLEDLPNLKSVNLYHSPLLPDDSHLKHLATNFPMLEELKIDFAAPRGSETSITPEGLSNLQKLPLQILHIENAGGFSEQHLAAIAKIKTLEAVLVEARRKPAPTQALVAFGKLRPDVEVVIAGPDAAGPPRRARKKP